MSHTRRIKPIKANSCYSRKLEEVFTEDYPKEGNNGQKVTEQTLPCPVEQPQTSTRKVDNEPKKECLGSDVSSTGKSVQGPSQELEG